MSTYQARRPQGTPAGGQFAPQHRGRPSSNALFDDVPVPQANSPEKVILVVDAVAAGCTTSDEIADKLGVVPRQGDYYASAAKSLGLVDGPDDGEWSLTPDGLEAATSDNARLVELLDRHLDANPHLQAYIEDGEEATVGSLEGSYADTTARRRTSTLASWAEYATSSDEERLARMSAARGEVAGREVKVRARVRPHTGRHRLSRRRKPAMCKQCSTALPSGTTSELCERCQDLGQ